MKGTEQAEKVVVLTSHVSRDSVLAANGIPANWVVRYLPRTRRIFMGPWIRRNTVELVKEYRVDIVHDHFYYLYSSFRRLRALPHSPLLVSSIYSYSRQWFAEIRNSIPTRSGAADWSRLRSLPGERRSLLSADFIVLQSEALAGGVTAHYRKIGARLLFLGNAVDHELFLPGRECREKFGIPAEAVAILMVGLVGRHKGADTAIRAFAKAFNAESLYYLVFAGRFPGDDERSIRELVDFYGLASRVLFLGQVGREELPDLYRSADIFLITSYQEGMPRVVLEAMSSGLPVVASNLPGVVSIDPNGRCVLFAQPGEAGKVAESLLLLASDPEERRRRGREGRAIVEENHTIDRIGEAIAGMYQYMLEERACGNTKQQ